MRLGLYGLLTSALLALPLQAQEAPIERTIQSQLDAFLADDFVTAFGFASPNLKTLFGSPDNFSLMVKKGYPMVWRHGAVQMLELRTVAGGLWQRVMITDDMGRTHLLDYQMVETPEGWQINAVQLLPEQSVGA